MEYRWQNKEVDLKSLATDVEQFLAQRDFVVRREEIGDTVRLVGSHRYEGNETRSVITTLSKLNPGLSVKFEAGEDLQPIIRHSLLIQFLGGGLILSKKLKAAEFYHKIESEFSTKIDEIVARHDLSQ